jgi:hypothetical protein
VDSLAEAALADLNQRRQPTVEQIEQKLFLEEYLKARNRGLRKVRRELQPMTQHE